MKLRIFSIYDEKAQAYNFPQYMKHNGEAIRALQNELDRKESMICKFPKDFSLYCLGEFDDNNGKFVGKSEPELVIRATDLMVDEDEKPESVKELKLGREN